MIIGIPKESAQNESRSAITPAVVKSYIKFGFNVSIESGAGTLSHITDNDLKEAGAEILDNSSDLYQKSNRKY